MDIAFKFFLLDITSLANKRLCRASGIGWVVSAPTPKRSGEQL